MENREDFKLGRVVIWIDFGSSERAEYIYDHRKDLEIKDVSIQNVNDNELQIYIGSSLVREHGVDYNIERIKTWSDSLWNNRNRTISVGKEDFPLLVQLQSYLIRMGANKSLNEEDREDRMFVFFY